MHWHSCILRHPGELTLFQCLWACRLHRARRNLQLVGRPRMQDPLRRQQHLFVSRQFQPCWLCHRFWDTWMHWGLWQQKRGVRHAGRSSFGWFLWRYSTCPPSICCSNFTSQHGTSQTAHDRLVCINASRQFCIIAHCWSCEPIWSSLAMVCGFGCCSPCGSLCGTVLQKCWPTEACCGARDWDCGAIWGPWSWYYARWENPSQSKIDPRGSAYQGQDSLGDVVSLVLHFPNNFSTDPSASFALGIWKLWVEGSWVRGKVSCQACFYHFFGHDPSWHLKFGRVHRWLPHRLRAHRRTLDHATWCHHRFGHSVPLWLLLTRGLAADPDSWVQWHWHWLDGPCHYASVTEVHCSCYPKQSAQASALPLFGMQLGQIIGPMMFSAIIGEEQERLLMNIAWLVAGISFFLGAMLMDLCFTLIAQHPVSKRMDLTDEQLQTMLETNAKDKEVFINEMCKLTRSMLTKGSAEHRGVILWSGVAQRFIERAIRNSIPQLRETPQEHLEDVAAWISKVGTKEDMDWFQRKFPNIKLPGAMEPWPSMVQHGAGLVQDNWRPIKNPPILSSDCEWWCEFTPIPF